jgi:hypothetical protein
MSSSAINPFKALADGFSFYENVFAQAQVLEDKNPPQDLDDQWHNLINGIEYYSGALQEAAEKEAAITQGEHFHGGKFGGGGAGGDWEDTIGYHPSAAEDIARSEAGPSDVYIPQSMGYHPSAAEDMARSEAGPSDVYDPQHQPEAVARQTPNITATHQTPEQAQKWERFAAKHNIEGVEHDRMLTKDEIQAMQKYLGVEADGVIGKDTRAAARNSNITEGHQTAAQAQQWESFAAKHNIEGVTADGALTKDEIQAIQNCLGVEADGIIGKNTRAAMSDYENPQSNGLEADRDTRPHSSPAEDAFTPVADMQTLPPRPIQKVHSMNEGKASEIPVGSAHQGVKLSEDAMDKVKDAIKDLMDFGQKGKEILGGNTHHDLNIGKIRGVMKERF